MRIVKLLVGKPPQTVSDLIKTAKLTRTAVTEQLNELVAAGFAERSVERLPGRGRPRHLYTATMGALLLLFASNQRLVVPAIWRAIRETGGEKLTRNILSRVSAIIADHYKQQITAVDPAERLRELATILREEGGLVEIGGTGEELVLHKRSCAFISMLDEKQYVCEIDQQLLSDVVGCPVRRIACRHSGDPCCSFEIYSTNGSA
jgi:predicted ArsR family transcriptional regulator